MKYKKILLVLCMLFVCLFINGCAQKEPEIVQYEVAFYNEDGELIKSIMVNANDTLAFPSLDAPTGYYYILESDESELENINDNISVYVKKRQLTKNVQFVVDGEVIKETRVSYNSHVQSPSIDESKYETYEWVLSETKDSISTVTQVYTLKYEVKVNFDVKFYDGDSLIDLDLKKYKSGTVVKLPTYTKEGYIFEGWYLSKISLAKYTEIPANMYGDVSFYARLTKVDGNVDKIEVPTASFTFTGIRHSDTYQPIFPAGVDSNTQHYNWTTSDNRVATISSWSSISITSTGYCVVTATLIDDPTYFGNILIKTSVDGVSKATLEEANTISLVNVTFKGKDGETLETVVIQKGSNVIYPTPPSYEGFKFNGWDKDNYNILEDTIITATYVSGVESYAGRKIAFIGDSISTFRTYIPEGFSCFYPYPVADVNDVNMTWWMQVSNKLGTRMFVNDSYSGSCVCTGGTSASTSDERLSYLTYSNETPDIIVIYMGSNDASAEFNANLFKTSYITMLEKIYALCGSDTEIVICTLPKSKLYSDTIQQSYNDVLKTLSSEYKTKLVDFSDVDIKPYLLDSAHPKFAGMTVIANKIVEELTK